MRRKQKNGTDEEKKQRGWASQSSDFGETEYDFYFYFLKTLGSKFLTSVILNVSVISDIVRYSRNWSVSNLEGAEPQIWEYIYI